MPAPTVNTVWERLQQERARGERVRLLAAAHRLNLTSVERRRWYDDAWSETVVNWPAVAALVDLAIAELEGKP